MEDSNYLLILDRSNLTTFERRPLMLDILFADKMLNGIINKPDISSQFHLCISRPSIRLRPFLKQELHRTSYDRHNCTNRSIAKKLTFSVRPTSPDAVNFQLILFRDKLFPLS